MNAAQSTIRRPHAIEVHYSVLDKVRFTEIPFALSPKSIGFIFLFATAIVFPTMKQY